MGRIVRRFHPLEGACVAGCAIQFPPRRPLRSYGTGGGPGRRTMRREGGGRWVGGEAPIGALGECMSDEGLSAGRRVFRSLSRFAPAG